jgi:hypothetical protein
MILIRLHTANPHFNWKLPDYEAATCYEDISGCIRFEEDKQQREQRGQQSKTKGCIQLQLI